MSEAAAHIAKPGVAIRGLYAVTPDESDTGVLAAKVSAALNGGAKLVQYRNKTADQRQRREHGARVADGLPCARRAADYPVISALFAASDVEAAAREIAAHFSPRR